MKSSKEYELIRQEMISVKECMTKYIGFVLGGSGLAIYAVLSMGHSSGKFYEIAFTCFLLSIIVDFVLLILVYKFFSHNRFAGYCKLLNHESYRSTGPDLFAWEICIARLRASESAPLILLDLVESVKIQNNIDKNKLKLLLLRYIGTGNKKHEDPVKDKNKFLKGLKSLFSAILLGTIGRSRSWGFPPMVFAIFFCIVFGFLAGGVYTIGTIPNMDNKLLDKNTMLVLAGIVLLIQFFLWYRFIGKLHLLMDGSCTVNGYFWRFLPVRALFLNENNIVPQYFYVDELLEEALERQTETD